MTLRSRLALLTSGAVAIAILAASIAAWFLIRATLLDDVEDRLRDRLPQLDQVAELVDQFEEGVVPVNPGRARLALQGDPIGIQIVAPDGGVESAIPPGDNVRWRVDEPETALFKGEPGEAVFRTETVDGVSYRIMSAALSDEFLVRLVHPLDSVEATMTRMTWLLIGVSGFGVVLAGGLGWLIVRAGMRPVGRLTTAAEQVATTKDLAHRIEIDGGARDELSRLAISINSMLAALDAARTEQRQLVENASHELRTPLTTLRNDVGVLLRAEKNPDRVLDDADRADLLGDLDAEVTGLSELVAELVDLARGETEPEPIAEVDLRTLVDRAVARCRRSNPDVDVVVSGAGCDATVRPATLERAITNVIRNAVQVSSAGGTVELDLAESHGWASVTVRDRGPGIAADDLPRIFDRFYRGSDARERPGSGLGLAIVAQAVAQHRGRVHADNRPGGGAVFTIRLPLHSR